MKPVYFDRILFYICHRIYCEQVLLSSVVLSTSESPELEVTLDKEFMDDLTFSVVFLFLESPSEGPSYSNSGAPLFLVAEVVGSGKGFNGIGARGPWGISTSVQSTPPASTLCSFSKLPRAFFFRFARA